MLLRKFNLALTSCVALVAFMGLSTQAFAVVEADCDGTPYSNDPLLHDVAIATPDSQAPKAVSGVRGSGTVCGSRASSEEFSYVVGGSNTQYIRVDVDVPPGVEINPTDGLAAGSYTGSANFNMLSWLGHPIYPILLTNVGVDLSVAPDGDGDCPGGEVACYKSVIPGATLQGHNWNWVTGDPSGGYTLTIGEFYNDTFGSPAGLTKINNFSLCGHSGDIGGLACGDSADPFLQKNGSATTVIPRGDRGIYSFTATTRDGVTTPALTASVTWGWHFLPKPKVPLP